jgi:hypothetical protein
MGLILFSNNFNQIKECFVVQLLQLLLLLLLYIESFQINYEISL